MAILNEIAFGKYNFEISVILRNSLLISGMLTNAEAWYDVKKSELEVLEKVDESLLRQILETPSCTPKEMLYLEMGVLPIRFIIMSRRINYLHYILNQPKESLLFRVFKAQLDNPVKNDWIETVKQDFETLNMELDMDGIKAMSEISFKRKVRKAVESEGLKYLNKLKKGDGNNTGHSKVAHIEHKKLEMMDYLKPNIIAIEKAKFIFLIRNRMLDIKNNFKNRYDNLLCIACKEVEETQEHLLACKALVDDNIVVDTFPRYDELFGVELNPKIVIAGVIQTNLRRGNSSSN